MYDYEIKVVGVIVLYNPEIQAIQQLLKNSMNQLGKVILVDNSEQPKSDFIVELNTYCSNLFEYINVPGNIGIAAAQNVGIQAAALIQASHVLLLDQDSQLPENMVTKLLGTEQMLINRNINVAAVGPAFFDVKTQKVSGAIIMTPFFKKMVSINHDEPEKTDYLIASGSLIRMVIFDTVGVMDESLFIDLVDIEWCERCNREGYSSFIAPDIVMDHNIGSGFVSVMGKNVVMHNDFRHYFVVRNSIYLLFKNSLSLSHKVFLLLRMPLFILTHTFLAKHKARKFKLFLIAIKDGVMNKMGRGYFN
jgi:rhamnosyltransferase